MSTKDIVAAAQGYLARREHGAKELSNKLLRKFPNDGVLVEEVMGWLQCNGLQSDQRYAELCIRSKVNKGYGPNHIHQYLKAQQLSESTIEHAISEVEVDWQYQINQVWQKKYKRLELQPKALMKQKQFLFYRGFLSDDINTFVKALMAREESS